MIFDGSAAMAVVLQLVDWRKIKQLYSMSASVSLTSQKQMFDWHQRMDNYWGVGETGCQPSGQCGV
jgi:hypothetical protein